MNIMGFNVSLNKDEQRCIGGGRSTKRYNWKAVEDQRACSDNYRYRMVRPEMILLEFMEACLCLACSLEPFLLWQWC